VTRLTRTHRPNKSRAFSICHQASTHDYHADDRIRQGWNCYPPEPADHAFYIRKHSNRGCHSAWETVSEAVTIRPLTAPISSRPSLSEQAPRAPKFGQAVQRLFQSSPMSTLSGRSQSNRAPRAQASVPISRPSPRASSRPLPVAAPANCPGPMVRDASGLLVCLTC
jgi:hypothetical protein